MNSVHDSGCDAKQYLPPDELWFVFVNTDGNDQRGDFVR